MRNKFHSICPYFAMFPEAFAERWIRDLTSPGEIVLDPFCGRGTTPFQALLMNREAVCSDINPVAYCITKAKTNSPKKTKVMNKINVLNDTYDGSEYQNKKNELPEFFKYAYDENVLLQIIYLRESLNWRGSTIDAMIAALVLGSLHGESQKSNCYLSNQMPHVISTKPNYSIRYWKKHRLHPPKKNVFELLRNRLEYRYKSKPTERRAKVLLTDIRELPFRKMKDYGEIRYVITSPPYMNVTSFEEDQWLRLWFLGGEPIPKRGQVSRDDRHSNASSYWMFISDMWRVFGNILGKRANIVIRIGGKNASPEKLTSCLLATSIFSKRKVSLISSEVSEIKKRQTNTFRPGSRGCLLEVDCHFIMK